MPFTASIIRRDFTSVYDNALLLGGASWLRKLTYGGTWARIRLGVLCAITPNGTSNISDAIFTIGLCSGTDYPASASNTRSAYGFSYNGSPVPGSTRTLSYTANSGYPFFNPTSGVVYRKTFLGYQVSASVGSFYMPLAYSGSQKRRFPIYVDITRNLGGGGLATTFVYGCDTTAKAQLDYRPDHFLDGLDQPGAPTIYNTAMGAGTTITAVGINDEFGPLDTFELFWSLNRFPLEVYAIGAVVEYQTYNPGTGLAYPDGYGGGFQVFSQYPSATQVDSMTSAYGTGFTDAGTIAGVSAGTLAIGWPGTSGGHPVDDFQQYATGSITSGVTLNAGTNWSSYGTIY